MAIIRKGDAEARRELRNKAATQRDFGSGITASQQRIRTKQRNAAENVKIDTTTGKATTLNSRYRTVEYKGGGISGAAISYQKNRTTSARNRPSLFTGVIESGKLVKGGNSALERNLKDARKNRNFTEGHDGAKA